MTESHEQKYDAARQGFAKLIERWMTINHWSHPVMTKLGKACLDDVAWFHSSQISGLRTGKLRNPGPRVFIALERLNYCVYRYVTCRELIPGTSSSAYYRDAQAIVVNGVPPDLGCWIELFCGQKDTELAQFLSNVHSSQND